MVNRNFTPFPVLTTARLSLRQLSIDDQQSIFDLRSNAEINKYLDRQPSMTIEDAVSFIGKVNENIERKNSLYWAITLTETKRFVGTVCLFGFSSQDNSCEIGYELLTEFQGQGIMREAVMEVIDYAFQKLRFEKIVAVTHSRNQGSTKLLMKLNFILSKEAVPESPDLSVFTLTHMI